MPKGGLLLRYRSSARSRSTTRSSTSRTTWRSSARSPTSCLQYYAVETDRLRRESDRAILASFGGLAFGDIALVPAPFLKHPKGIRDVAEWYMSTVSRFDYVYELFDRQCGIGLENLAKIYDVVGDRVSAVFVTGTDFGTQTGPFIGPAAYRKLYQPFHRRVNDWVHEHTGWKTFIHSCGSVIALLPDIVEAGFDILNPVQCSAAGMDPATLKQRFGDKLTFWGGGVDTQQHAALRHARRNPPAGPRPHRHLLPRRRLRLQRDPQHPGQHPRRKPAGPVRRRAEVAVNGTTAAAARPEKGRRSSLLARSSVLIPRE